MNTSFARCPADAADRPGELELALASGLPAGRAQARTADRDDCRPVLCGKVNDLLACQVALECQHPAIIDDRDVGARSRAAHINAHPNSHAS